MSEILVAIFVAILILPYLVELACCLGESFIEVAKDVVIAWINAWRKLWEKITK